MVDSFFCWSNDLEFNCCACGFVGLRNGGVGGSGETSVHSGSGG